MLNHYQVRVCPKGRGGLSAWLQGLVAALVGGLLLVGCGGPSGGEVEVGRSEGAPLKVVATTAMIGDVAQILAGEAASVQVLMGPGVDPHLYQPTRDDLVALDGAEVILYHGLHLEGRMTEVLSRQAMRGKTVSAVAEVAVESGRVVALGDGDAIDPHLWMDVTAWSEVAVVIEAALKSRLPAEAAAIEERRAAYQEQLAALDRYAREVLGTIPPEQRILVTAHDAFGYLGRAFGLEVRGIQGISTESEAGLRDLNELVDFIVQRRLPAVFVETSVSDRNVRALIEGCAARGHRVVVGGELFSDAMGPSDAYEGTYVGMIDHNVTILARALGGKAPVGGWQGRLRAE